MRLVTAVAVALSTVAVTTSARADDCAGFSADLRGAAADTIGVSIDRDATGAWTMKVRPKPGADAIESTLTDLPADHAHYWVYVTPGRKRVLWILASADHDRARADQPFVWAYDARGTLVRTATFGDVFTADEVKAMPYSISHLQWAGDKGPAHRGARITIPARWGQPVVIDDAGARIKRTR